jgi:hypothetical protein
MKMEKSKEEAQRTNGEHVQERGNNTNTSTLLQMENIERRRFFN